MIPSPLKGVLFDFDGVVGETMNDNYRAWTFALERQGISIDKHAYFLLEGHTSVEVAHLLLRKSSGREPTRDAVMAVVHDKERHYAENNSFAFYPDLKPFVIALKQLGVRAAIVSGGSRKRIEEALGSNQMDEYFQAIIAADDYKQGKPSPEPYLMGLNALKLDATECIVVENAPLGITAAKKAGMHCVAVCSTLEAQDLSHADDIVETLGQAQQLILGFSKPCAQPL